MKGVKADGSYDCVSAAIDAASLPADGLNEVSGGLLTTHFAETAPSAKAPFDIADGFPAGVTDEIVVPDFGIAQGLSVAIDLTNSNIAKVKVTVYDPNGNAYVLHDKTSTGTALKTTYPSVTALVSGDLGSWTGKNPKGKWSISVADLAGNIGGTDGTLQSWSIQVKTLSSAKVGVGGVLMMYRSAGAPLPCSASVAGGQLILRLAVSGSGVGTPSVDGLQALSVEHYGDTTVALYAFTRQSLYQLRVTGTGAYTMGLSLAGDLNLDGLVDGLDSALVQAPAADADITGDGSTDRSDRQGLFANFGFTMNVGPQLAADLPDVFTHEDLRVRVDLGQVATDPDGDPVFYRIVSSSNGTTTLSADGRFAIFTPDAGFSGSAELQLSADDGFNASPVATAACA